jgi:hypothetical protein
MAKVPYVPSYEELSKGLDALHYEIKQLIDMIAPETSSTALNNAIIESRLVHVRSLRDFFAVGTREEDDIL